MNRVAAMVGASAVVAGAAFTMATPAAHAATDRNGKCETGEFCLFFNSGEKGSVSDFKSSVADYGATQPSCYDFKGTGAGKGQCVKNHTASVTNKTSKTVYVYYNSNYGGTKQAIAAGKSANLVAALKNNNASHHIGAVSGQTPVDDYKGHWDSTYGFAYRNCTAFAAYRIVHRLGVSGFRNNWRGQVFGDAQHWDNAAANLGYKVDKTPKVGGIVINDVHHSSKDGKLHGHVAYIYKVYSNGSFDVEEYNWSHGLSYGTRHISGISGADAGFQHVIHF